MNKVGIVLPTRKGSQRVNNKNTRPFCGYSKGLLELKLRQLEKVENVTVYLTTNDESSIETAEQFQKDGFDLKIFERPQHLCLDTTNLTDLIKYMPTIIEEEHILWTHVTSPLVDSISYQTAIEKYFKVLEDGYDSLMSVHKIQDFLWSKESKKIINVTNDSIRWPRTQDLEPLYRINSAIFLTHKNEYIKGDRVGNNPYLMEMSSLLSMDVDWEDDFLLAEVLFEKYGSI